MRNKISLLDASLFFLLFILILIPASGLLSIKIFSLSLFICAFFAIKNNAVNFYDLILLFFFVILLLVSSLNTLFTWSYKEDVLLFFTSFFLIALIVFLGRNKVFLNNSVLFLKFIYHTSVILGVVKFLIISLPMLEVISGQKVVLFFTANFPGVSSQLFWGSDKFVRISILNELIFTFCFLLGMIFIRKKYFTGKIYLVTQLILILACILSFQRFIWLYLILISTAYFLLYSRKNFFYLTLLTCLIFVLGKAPGNSSKGILDVLMVKINDTSSLDTKSVQVSNILYFFSDSPLLGTGLTTYIPSYIRSEFKPYIYEFQFGTLLLQFGLLGIMVYLSFFFIMPYLSILKLYLNKDTVLLSLSFVMLLLSSFVNPYLLSVTAIPFFLIHYFMFWENKNGS